MLAIHKVDNPYTLELLWNHTSKHDYHNFSSLFLHDGTGGWHEILSQLKDKEASCSKSNNITKCLEWRKKRKLMNEKYNNIIYTNINDDSDNDDGDT